VGLFSVPFFRYLQIDLFSNLSISFCKKIKTPQNIRVSKMIETNDPDIACSYQSGLVSDFA
ncbi:hypothetical protein, partial [Enterococcus avium]|uniref:hypothetical protein n=2 Tax=Enterococcus TaxID=1350 RepID=UPI0022E1644F